MAVRVTAEQLAQFQRNLASVKTHKPGVRKRVRKSPKPAMLPRRPAGNVKSTDTIARGERSYAGGENRFSKHIARAKRFARAPKTQRAALRTVRRSRPIRIGFSSFGTFLIGITGVGIALTLIRHPTLFTSPVRLLVSIFRAFVAFAGGKRG